MLVLVLTQVSPAAAAGRSSRAGEADRSELDRVVHRISKAKRCSLLRALIPQIFLSSNRSGRLPRRRGRCIASAVCEVASVSITNWLGWTVAPSGDRGCGAGKAVTAAPGTFSRVPRIELVNVLVGPVIGGLQAEGVGRSPIEVLEMTTTGRSGWALRNQVARARIRCPSCATGAPPAAREVEVGHLDGQRPPPGGSTPRKGGPLARSSSSCRGGRGCARPRPAAEGVETLDHHQRDDRRCPESEQRRGSWSRTLVSIKNFSSEIPSPAGPPATEAAAQGHWIAST